MSYPPYNPPGGGGRTSTSNISETHDGGGYPTTTPQQDALENELSSLGVTTARHLVRRFTPRRIEAAIRAYRLQIEYGDDDVGPGLLAWYIKEGIEPIKKKAKEEDWVEKRYARSGKGALR